MPTHGTPCQGTFFSACVVALLLAGACTGPEQIPTRATVVIEADPEEPLFLITSSDFEVIGDGSMVFAQADTLPINENFNREFRMQDPPRFTAILRNDSDEENESVRLSVLIDGRTQYDEIAVLGTKAFLQFVYRYKPFDTN